MYCFLIKTDRLIRAIDSFTNTHLKAQLIKHVEVEVKQKQCTAFFKTRMSKRVKY